METSKGFTLIELVVVVFVVAFLAIVVCYIGIGGAVVMGNQWFTEDGVLKKIQLDHPEAVRIVDAERDVFQKSIIVVEQKDGGRGRYCLDSNILFNYTITACDK